MDLTLAPDITAKIKAIQKKIQLPYLDLTRITCFRSFKSTGRARARIWGFPRILQIALKTKPHYCLEVISEKFDHLNSVDQTQILIHELLHIPKNFSGALIPHGTKRSHFVNLKRVKLLYDQYCSRR